MPQGTLAEKIRAGGAGVPAFYTATGAGTDHANGKIPVKYNPDGTVAEYNQKRESKVINGREYILEDAMTADFAIIKAWKGDKLGNLVFRGTSRNFNPDMAKAAKCCIAEVEELVEPGEIKPEDVHLPSIFVHRIVKSEILGTRVQKPNEKESETTGYMIGRHRKYSAYDLSITSCMTFSLTSSFNHAELTPITTDTGSADNAERALIASRVALEFKDGDYVNLGIGIPDYSASFIPEGVNVLVHSENGVLGMGPDPPEGHEDPDLLNASKEAITYVKGSSLFTSSDSFAIVRGGHLDVSVLGALQVSQTGDLANWCIPGKMMKGIGGAMDLVAGVKRIVVATSHVTKDGKPKIVKQCSLPLTGARVVDTIITDLAVFKVKKNGGLVLTERALHTSIDEIRAKTEADFEISPMLKLIDYSPMKSSVEKEVKPERRSEVDAEATPIDDDDIPVFSPGQLRDMAELYKIVRGQKCVMNALKGAMAAPSTASTSAAGDKVPAVSPEVLSIVSKQGPALATAVKANQKLFVKMMEQF
jgi:3-oxoacid CoA-transferase